MFRSMKLLRDALLSMGLLLFAGNLAIAEEGESLDWSAWRHLPVMHQGRIMPMDTFAAEAAELICNRENPKLSIDDAAVDLSPSSPLMADMQTLFPAGERQFTAVELVFSWLAEPEKWEHVPFLIAEHDELRELLEAPVTNKAGEHLKYVSPSQVQDSDALYKRLTQIQQKRQAAQAEGKQFQLTGLDEKANELWQAFALFRNLTVSDMVDGVARRNFDEQFQALADTWVELSPQLSVFRTLGAEAALGSSIMRSGEALQQIAEASGQNRMNRSEVEPLLTNLQESVGQLARDFGSFSRRLKSDPPEGWDDEQLARAKELIDALADGAQRLEQQVDGLQEALYHNEESLRVVPALNAAALEAERDPEEAAQPWLDLETLLTAPESALAAYPQPKVTAVREAFAKATSAYTDRDNAGRSDEFAAAQRSLARALRDLGEAVEPLRLKLPLDDRDEDLIAYTAYPAVDHTATEVRYNTVDPFMKSWIISLFAVFCFALAFGVLRKPMFWLGMVVLAAGLIWTIYGFYLRVLITGFAPVTGMYETVIYVPFFVSLLGMWFALLPLTWEGLTHSWRMTALPGTWETTPLNFDQQRIASPTAWTLGGAVAIVLRLGLMALTFWLLAVAPYAAGDRQIINLLPVADVGSGSYTFNDFLTWAVGLCVLIPSVWFLPRAVVALLYAVAIVPLTLLKTEGRQPRMPQVYARWPFALAATFVAFFGSFVAWYSPVLDESFSPLTPVLRDNFWLTIHVLTIVSSYGAGALGWGLGNIALAYYLFGRYRPAVTGADYGDAHRATADAAVVSGRRPPEACNTLAGYIYKTVQVAVLLLVAGTILGGLWADVSWGRFWGWDPKEVWALISALVYLAILHGRYAGWFGNFGLAVGSVLGATAIIFSWYGVNFVLGAGLHSYGFGAGGQYEVGIAVVVNWIFLLAAAIRYFLESNSTGSATPGTPSEAELEAASPR